MIPTGASGEISSRSHFYRIIRTTLAIALLSPQMPRLQVPLKAASRPSSRSLVSTLATGITARPLPAFRSRRSWTHLVSAAYISPRDPFRATSTQELGAPSFSGSICPFPFRHPALRREMATSTPADGATTDPNAAGSIGAQVPDEAAASESTSGVTAEMLEGRLREALGATEVAVEDISGTSTLYRAHAAPCYI
jgi:hypothetical protein